MKAIIDTANQQELPPAIESRPLTVAEVRHMITEWTDLAPGRMQKMRTALSTAARALAPMQTQSVANRQVLVECQILRRLRQAPPATFGLSAGRMTSLISELVFICRRLGLHEPDTRRTSLTSDSLRTLYESLPTGRQLALIDFFRYLDRIGAEPNRVNSDTLIAYEAEKRDRTICRDPVRRMKQVAEAWDWAGKHVQGWPPTCLRTSLVPKSTRLALPLDAFPVTFQDDVRRYVDRLSGSDLDYIFPDHIFDDDQSDAGHTLRRLRPATIKGRVRHIRCAATALMLTGTLMEHPCTLRDLVDPPEHASAVLRFYLKRNKGKTQPQLQKLADSLRLIARDYCCLPPAELKPIATWAKRVRMPKTRGMTEKNRKRLRFLMVPRVRAMLLHLPLHLMKEATAMDASCTKAAARLEQFPSDPIRTCPARV